MGRFSPHRADREARAAEANYNREMSEWTAVAQHLSGLLNEAKTVHGLTAEETHGLVLQLKSDELVFWVAQGAVLVEPRRGPTTYQGGYQGFSFPIGHTGIRYRIGAGRGHAVQGQEKPTAVDTGVATITNRRIVFQGPLQTREWDYSKLLGYQHFDSPPWTALQVSNRQKTSGFLYDNASAHEIQFRIVLALANYNHTLDQLIGQLESELARHESVRPLPPPPRPADKGSPAGPTAVPTSGPPAGSATGTLRKWWNSLRS
jgi:hypothetical protein